MTITRACITIALLSSLGSGQGFAQSRPEITLSEEERIQAAALRPFVVDSCPKVGRGYPGGCVVTVEEKNVSAGVREFLSRDARVRAAEDGDFEFKDGGTGAFRRRLALIVNVRSLARTAPARVFARIAILAGGLSSRECNGVVLRAADGAWAMDDQSTACTIS